MDLTPYVAALRDDLAAAAAVGDEATTRAGSALAAALEPAVRLALMNALSDLAGEVSEALGDRTVSLRLAGREVRVVVDRDPAAEDGSFFAGPASSPFAGTPSGGPGPHRHTPPPPPGPGFGGPGSSEDQGFGGRGGPDVGDISRMTLRLVDQIKGQAERAAAAQGMSLNSWIGQAVQGALKGQYGGHRHGPWGRWDEGWGRWGQGWDQGGDRGRDEGREDDRPAGTTGSGTTGSGTTGSGTSGSGTTGPTATDPSGPSDSSRGSDAPGAAGRAGDPGDAGRDGGRDGGGEGGTGGVDGWVKG